MPSGSHLLSPPQKKISGCQIIYLFRSCCDHFRAEQEHRLDGVLLEPVPQVRQEQPHCGEEPLDADLRHRERSEREAIRPHRCWVGWDDVSHIHFLKTSTESGKVVDGECRERALVEVEFQGGTRISEK